MLRVGTCKIKMKVMGDKWVIVLLDRKMQ